MNGVVRDLTAELRVCVSYLGGRDSDLPCGRVVRGAVVERRSCGRIGCYAFAASSGRLLGEEAVSARLVWEEVVRAVPAYCKVVELVTASASQFPRVCAARRARWLARGLLRPAAGFLLGCLFVCVTL